ncbi:flagellar biosynthetic protein FliO [Pseudobacteriovorax antillogorgiicola]|uniref:Flagellar biogenesis protein FliO n=1 Tax=Pseudobacteriovorax antillogorgiicola TaxID=1513793 RepID=A0A1Y6CHV1_9BACT|nr:flagellar biosynthetic protein FliO [Pseudobacteriovorax antillogorgiicola]TCS46661.1 flagellar biogenesis protein FliO [Pseudobacteriovorax antillogorgiicola]SMF66519.1 Flagellar biogenesis protein FliO [Pseudobacteriovorax antillogorgiicola]
MKVLQLVTMIVLVIGMELHASSKTFEVSAVKTDVDDQSSLISILYKDGVPKKDVTIEEHGTFIQVKVPATTVLEPGKFYDSKGPYFRKIATFQIDEQTAGIRMFVTQETKSLIGSLTTEFLNDRLLIHLDHKTVKPVHIDDSPPVGEVIARTKVRHDIEDPAKKIREAQSDSSKNEADMLGEELHEKLIYITIIGGGFLMLFFMSLTIRRLIAKTGLPRPDGKAVPMRTVASYSLAPKQNLTLVEVGRHQVLLGVSPDGINYLTSIPPDQPSSVGPSHDSLSYVRRSESPLLNQTKAPLGGQKPMNSNPAMETMNPVNRVMKKVAKEAEKGKRNEPQMNRDQGQEYEGVKTSFSTQKSGDSRSIEDVTNLIRSKLKNLPSV